MALVDYFEPKAKAMVVAWNSSQTKQFIFNEKVSESRFFHGISVANQLFSVLIRLRSSGLVVADVCCQFKISEGTYSQLFSTWICFLSKGLRILFPFPSREQRDE